MRWVFLQVFPYSPSTGVGHWTSDTFNTVYAQVSALYSFENMKTFVYTGQIDPESMAENLIWGIYALGRNLSIKKISDAFLYQMMSSNSKSTSICPSYPLDG